MEYLVPVVLAIIGIIMRPKFKSETPVKIWMGLIWVYIILLIGLRYRVGTDTFIYMDRYEKMPTLEELFSGKGDTDVYEPLYLLINCICKSITYEFWPVQMVMATITSTGIFIFLYRNCKNVFVGIFLYLIFQWLFFGTEVMRESAAVSIFLVGYKYCDEKKWGKYYSFCALAITMHYSAILTLFFPLVKKLKFNWWFIGICLVMLFITPLVENVNKFLALGILSEKLSYYIKDSINLNINFRLMEFIRNGIAGLFILGMYKRSDLKCKFRGELLLQVVLSCGAFAIPVVFHRFSNYTAIFFDVAVANYLCNGKVKHLTRLFALIFVLGTQMYHYGKLYKDRCFPYVSIFNAEKDKDRERLFREIWKAH